MNDFNNIVKGKLDSFQQAPPPDLLNNIKKQYPKRSFVETISYNKFFLIAAITGIIVLGYFVLNNNNSDNSISQIAQTNNSFEKSIIPTSDNNITNETNQDLNIQNYIEPKQINSSSKQLITKEVSYFKTNDTSVCGQTIDIPNIASLENIVLPINLSAQFESNRMTLTADNIGEFTIKYLNKLDNILEADSMLISFRNNLSPVVTISKESLCYGEDLEVNINARDYSTNWLINNASVNKVNDNIYRISNLQNGKNKIQINFVNENNCQYKYVKTISMLDELNYKMVSTPNFCGSSNATLDVSTEAYNADEFTLNNSIVSDNGKFTNLSSGIYCMEISYGPGCYTYDTLLIMDSLNINPYFRSEKDLVNKNRYFFLNLTNIDNYGYERNNNIEFSWKINGVEEFTTDNPEYEFTEEGEYTIELVARINNLCYSSYSETIMVSGSNFRIPNIFTPNGDGMGDYFKVVYEGELVNYNLQIVNKTGELVFTSNDINETWDGKRNGNNYAGEGLYYYIIGGEDKFGNKIEQKGSLQLVRN